MDAVLGVSEITGAWFSGAMIPEAQILDFFVAPPEGK